MENKENYSDVRTTNLNDTEKLDWVDAYFEYELEGRSKQEQIQLLEKFRDVSARLLKSI